MHFNNCQVTSGTGLTGGGTSGDVTLNADAGYLQRRVTGACAVGSSITGVNPDGTVSCADTTAICTWDDLEYSTGAVCCITKYKAYHCRSSGSWVFDDSSSGKYRDYYKCGSTTEICT